MTSPRCVLPAVYFCEQPDLKKMLRFHRQGDSIYVDWRWPYWRRHHGGSARVGRSGSGQKHSSPSRNPQPRAGRIIRQKDRT